MSSILCMCNRLALGVLTLTAPLGLRAQTALSPVGGEYKLTATLPGDQTRPQLAVSASKALLVWQDNATDNEGLGISAQWLDRNFAPTMGAFRINETGAGDQENPQAAFLKDGGAVVVWQGGKAGAQQIFARFLTASNTFASGDILVSSFADGNQGEPHVAAGADGSVIVAYTSFGQDGNMQGVFAQRLSATGQKLGGEFQVNQFSTANQRSPALAALANGNFLVAWVSEQQRFENSVDVYARLFSGGGQALVNEFRMNTATNVCANPSVAAAADGGFAAAWSQNFGFKAADGQVSSNSWDVVARTFDAQGKATCADLTVNTFVYGDQYAPKLSARANEFFIVWTSLGQDSSWEGAYGRGLHASGSFISEEIPVNTTVISKQINPVVASDGDSRFLVAWSSFVGGEGSFELLGQRFYVGETVQQLVKPTAPMAFGLSQSRLSVTWPEMSGYPIAQYLVYMDESPSGAAVTNTYYVAKSLVPGTTHSFRVQYQLKDGRSSPLSDPGTGSTWGEDENGDGLPDDWQAAHWGPKWDNWPAAQEDTDGDGASNYQEYLAGTNPLNPNSVLRTQLTATDLGWRLSWNTQAGLIYQVQTSPDFARWTDVGAPRYAAGTQDATLVIVNQVSAYYRIVRVR